MLFYRNVRLEGIIREEPKIREESDRGEMKRGLFKKDNQREGKDQEKKQGSLQIWTRSKTRPLETVTFSTNSIRHRSKQKVKNILIIC